MIATLLAIAALCGLGPVEIGWVEAVPLSLQSLVVLVVPLVLGRTAGTVAVVAYVLLGLAGLPVFAEGTSGIAKIWGPTAGFIVGFVVAALAVGSAADRGWTQRWWQGVVAMVLGHGVIVAVGFAWLAWAQPQTSLGTVLWGLLPGLLLKSAVGGGIAWAIRWAGRRTLRPGTSSS